MRTGNRSFLLTLFAAATLAVAQLQVHAAPITARFGLLGGEFVVREVAARRVMLDDVHDARRLIRGDLAPLTAPATGTFSTVNFLDPQNGGEGHFGAGVAFPGDSPGDDQAFAVRVRGWVEIPEAGEYTFGVNSDDGFRLRVGPLFMRHRMPRSTADSLGTATFPHAGRYRLKLTYFEQGNDAELELFAARGRYATFEDGSPTEVDTDPDVSPVPLPGPVTGPGDSEPPRLGPGLEVNTPIGPTVPEPTAGLITFAALSVGSLLSRGRRRRLGWQD